jgi:hypothetical protein
VRKLKQFITGEQLKTFIANHDGDLVDEKLDILFKALGLNEFNLLMPELITIGKMIEILEDNDIFDIEFYCIGKDSYNLEVNHFKVYFADNKCDCLWLAVKEILNKESGES